MKNLTLQVLEAKHWALVDERMAALQEAVNKADPRQRSAIIQRFNCDPFYENRFDEIAAQIRELDPNHPLLPENNYE